MLCEMAVSAVYITKQQNKHLGFLPTKCYVTLLMRTLQDLIMISWIPGTGLITLHLVLSCFIAINVRAPVFD